MAGLVALNVVGLVSGILGIVQFGKDNFGAADEEGKHSVLKIRVGLDQPGGLDNAGGDLPDVRLFNEVGEFLGIAADPGDVEKGTTGEIKVTHSSGEGQQAPYAVLSGNNNAICIAHISITWPDGSNYAWVGDWGEICSKYYPVSWYPISAVFINGANHQPGCTWVDADGDLPHTGLQIRFPEFVRKDGEAFTDPAEITAVEERICNSGVPFKVFTEPDPDTVTYWTDPAQRKYSTKRAFNLPFDIMKSRKRRHYGAKTSTHSFDTTHKNHTIIHKASTNAHVNRLVMNNSTNQEAKRLCQSPSSLGPDFVDITSGLFCRMSDKTLFSVCSAEIWDNCFSLTVHQLIIGGLATRDTPYGDILDWSSSS